MPTLRLGTRVVLGLTLALSSLAACGDDDSDDDVVVQDSGIKQDAGPKQDGGSTASADAGSTPADSGSNNGSRTIVDLAVADGRFTVLAKALTDTGLVSTLQGAGPFTVFAPTDDAFAALPEGTLASLSNDQLKTILTYHAVASRLPASALKAGPVATVSKFSAFVSTTDGVKVNDAKVTTADINASNGVIHVIDKVLLPPNLVQAAQYAGSFTSLVGAVTKAGLASTLSAADANLTVFAPTDTAFAALPPGTVDSLSTSALGDLLKYHVVAGQKLSTALTAGSVPTLLTGKSVTVSVTGGVKINDANVVIADVVTTNGVIHAIDKVLTVP